MPFLAAIPAAIAGVAAAAAPAALGGLASSAIGAGISAAANGGSGNSAGFKAQGTQLDNPVSQADAQEQIKQSQNAIAQQQAFTNAVASQNGLGNQSSVFNQQQGLANQLGAMAQGAGPDPAAAALANATGANIANQAALMGSQRGAQANPALLARMAAMQGSNIQQNSAGQAALMKQQQQLNAINVLQQQQGMMGNLSTQQVGQQAGALQNLNAVNQSQQQQQLAAIQNQNANRVAMQSNINNANAGIAGKNAEAQHDQTAGMMGGIGSALTSGATKIFGAEGGEVGGPNSFVVKHLKSLEDGMPMAKHESVLMAKGGRPVTAEMLAAKGSMVPGKAKVKGDSLKNDTVDAKLSPKEIVLPRSVTMSSDPVGNSAKFVAAILAKNGELPKKPKSKGKK